MFAGQPVAAAYNKRSFDMCRFDWRPHGRDAECVLESRQQKCKLQ
jgi:hypothetical protein